MIGGSQEMVRAKNHRACAALLCGALALSAPAAPAFAGATSMDWNTVAKQAVPSVVNITIETITNREGTPERGIAVGTGFIIDPSGLIATNHHVINQAFRITVTLADKSQWNAKLVAAGQLLDIAVIKINVGHPLPTLKFGDSSKAAIGDPVMVIGTPLGLGTSLSAGIISALHRNLMNTPIDDYIQTDASINHGNSGGPMLDRDGQVIGISTILITNEAGEGSQGLGMAIAGNEARYEIRHLLDPSAATVGWLGFHLQTVTPPLQTAFHLQQGGGSVITAVDPDSPASKAGLRIGDVIVRYGDAVPPTSSALMRAIVATPIGTTVPVSFVRQGAPMQVSMTVADMRGLESVQAWDMSVLQNAATARAPDLGLVFAPMTPAARLIYKYTVNSGAVIAAVDPTSDAALNGVTAGDVLQQVGDEVVTDAGRAFRAIEDARAKSRFVAILVASRDGSTRWVPLYSGAGRMGNRPDMVAAPAPGLPAVAAAAGGGGLYNWGKP
jgi:serine protease Do